MAGGKKKIYNQPCSPAAMIFPSWYSVIEKLIHFFAGSPYTNAENYEETLHRLTDIFYSFKRDTWESVSDNQLIEFMKDAFDGSCRGSLELPAQKCDEWTSGESSSLPIEKAQGILLLEDTFESKTKEQIESALKTALGRLKIYLDVPQRSITYALACLPALAANIANATEHNALDKVFLVPKVVT